jgi:uncharacterized protein
MNLTAQYQRLLERQGCSKGIIDHSLAVTKKALEISSKLTIAVDEDLIIAGAMLHDIGRSKTHGIEHFQVGGELARKLGLGVQVANLIERHIGAGITGEEAKAFGLPPKDFLPLTPEENIVSYADNLTRGAIFQTFPEALEKFIAKLGDNHPAIERFKKQHNQILSWIRKS